MYNYIVKVYNKGKRQETAYFQTYERALGFCKTCSLCMKDKKVKAVIHIWFKENLVEL